MCVAKQQDADLRTVQGRYLEGVTPFGESLPLAACLANEQLPMYPDLPADLFAACLTSPIEIAMQWFLLKSDNLPTGITIDMVMQIQDHCMLLGKLNWIFTAVTEIIAWTTFPWEVFNKVFQQDLLIATLFQNYLLAKRIMKNYHCTTHMSPALLPTNTHLMHHTASTPPEHSQCRW